MQKHVNLVDLVKSFPTHILLQNLASIQKRTRPIKFAHLAEKSEKGSTSDLSTKLATAMIAASSPLRANLLMACRTAARTSASASSTRAASTLVERFDIEPNELFRSEFGQNSWNPKVRILGIQRKPRKAPSRKKPLQRSGMRPKIQEGAARKERKGKQTALRERGVRRARTGAEDAILAIKRCDA